LIVYCRWYETLTINLVTPIRFGSLETCKSPTPTLCESGAMPSVEISLSTPTSMLWHDWNRMSNAAVMRHWNKDDELMMCLTFCWLEWTQCQDLTPSDDSIPLGNSSFSIFTYAFHSVLHFAEESAIFEYKHAFHFFTLGLYIVGKLRHAAISRSQMFLSVTL